MLLIKYFSSCQQMMVHTFFLPIFTAAKDEKYFSNKRISVVQFSFYFINQISQISDIIRIFRFSMVFNFFFPSLSQNKLAVSNSVLMYMLNKKNSSTESMYVHIYQAILFQLKLHNNTSYAKLFQVFIKIYLKQEEGLTRVRVDQRKG